MGQFITCSNYIDFFYIWHHWQLWVLFCLFYNVVLSLSLIFVNDVALRSILFS